MLKLLLILARLLILFLSPGSLMLVVLELEMATSSEHTFVQQEPVLSLVPLLPGTEMFRLFRTLESHLYLDFSL